MQMIRLLGVLVLMGCVDMSGPTFRQRPAGLLYCGYDYPDPECPPPEPEPKLSLWASVMPPSAIPQIPDSLVVHAYEPTATALYATLTVALDPGNVVFRYVSNGPSLDVVTAFDFQPSRVVWRVTAVRDYTVTAVDSLVWCAR